MNATEFIKIAREKISDDPKTRLTPKVKAALDNPECLVDIHTHIFDKRCLTVAYILLRLLKSKILESLGLESDGMLGKDEEQIYEDLKNKKLDTKSDWKKLESELDETIEMAESVELFGFELKEAFRVLKKKSMLEVLDYYVDNFSIAQIDEFKDKPFVTGILMMDLETGWEISPESKYHQQIEEIKDIATKRPILPFFAIDPRRADSDDPNENLYSLFLKAFVDDKAPFFGVKCYPSLGYLPSDARLAPIFEICAEKKIPVLSHCGGEIVSTFKKKIPVRNSTGEIQFTIPGNSRVERARFLNDPAHWDMVLEKHKGLKLNLAHFGGDTNWELFGKDGTNQRVEKIIEMMKNPEWNVYSDFSFNVVESNLFAKLKEILEVLDNKRIAEKTMYGTDYWVVLPAGDLLGMQKEFLTLFNEHQQDLLQNAPRSYLFD